MTELLVIANGKYQSGIPAARWDEAAKWLRQIFGDRVEIHYTARRGDGVRLAREALDRGVNWLAAAGGDGTIHEVVNGYFDGCRNIRPLASLSFVPCGRGNDWVRSLGLRADMRKSVEALAQGRTRRVDVGHVHFQNLLAKTEERIFINVAEAGMGAKVLENLSRRPGHLGPPRSYVFAALAATFSYAPRSLHLALDGTAAAAMGPLLSLIAANGCYFGAGMRCAPMARPDDGLLEVIAIGNFGKAEVIFSLSSFIKGTYLNKAKVRHYSAKSLTLTSEEPVLFELDGELVGALPACITILPQALQLRC